MMRWGVLMTAVVVLAGCPGEPRVDVDLSGDLDECFVETRRIGLDDTLLGFSAEEVLEQANRRQAGIVTWVVGDAGKLEFSVEPDGQDAVVIRLDPELQQPRGWCEGVRSRMQLETTAMVRTEDGLFDERIPALLMAIDREDEPPFLSLESSPVDVRGLGGTWAANTEPDPDVEALIFRVLFEEPFEVWEGGFVWTAHGLVVGQRRQTEATSESSCEESGSACDRLVAWWQFQP